MRYSIYDVFSNVHIIYMRYSILYLMIFYGVFSDIHFSTHVAFYDAFSDVHVINI
jgi:hypothetical protein